MTNLIVHFFIFLSALALGLSLFFVWRTLRTLFDADRSEPQPQKGSGETEESE